MSVKLCSVKLFGVKLFGVNIIGVVVCDDRFLWIDARLRAALSESDSELSILKGGSHIPESWPTLT